LKIKRVNVSGTVLGNGALRADLHPAPGSEFLKPAVEAAYRKELVLGEDDQAGSITRP